MFFIIPLVILGIGLVGMAVVTVLKFPQLSNIDLENLPAEKELKKKKEMIENALLNDDAYRQLNEEHKKIGAKKSGAKSRVLLVPATKKLNDDVLDLTSELRSLKEALSAYIAEYKKKTGCDTIEMADGRTYRFAVAYQMSLFEQQRKDGKKKGKK